MAVVGLGVNLFSVLLLGGHSHEHAHAHPHPHDHDEPHVHDNLNLRAAHLHVVADAMTSVLAIAALLGGKFLQWNWLDPLMGIAGAVLIVRWTYLLLGETGSILLDRATHDGVAMDIRHAIEANSDARISDLHLWKVGQNKYACIVSLVALEPLSADDYKARLHPIESLVHVTVETTHCSPPPQG